MRLCIPFIIVSSRRGSLAVDDYFIALVSDPRSVALLLFDPKAIPSTSDLPRGCRALEPVYRDPSSAAARIRWALDELKHRMIRDGTKSFRRLRLGLVAPLIHRFVKVPSSDTAMAIAILEHSLPILESYSDYRIEWLELDIALSRDRVSASIPEIEARFSWLYANDEGFRRGIESIVGSR